MKRSSTLESLKSGDVFDLLVIGGGATGCGSAADAASRGLKVALVEKNDLAEGTSSKSTKLIKLVFFSVRTTVTMIIPLSHYFLSIINFFYQAPCNALS